MATQTMSASQRARSKPIPVRTINDDDLRFALRQGYSDFGDLRGDLIFAGLIYTVLGLAAVVMTTSRPLMPFFYPVVAGVALLGPIAAVGFYELARRRESGGESPRCIVLWGARVESDLFAREEITALAARAGADLRIYLTAPETAWTGGRGRITAALLADLPRLAAPTFYLVGNGAMITEVKRELVARGVNRKAQIRTEAFFD